jgi:hypothetical protein
MIRPFRTPAALGPLGALLLGSLLLTGSSPVLGGDAMSVTISNNTSTNLIVSVYDLNTRPVQQLLSGETVNGFATVSVSLTVDGTGRGHLKWTAVTVSRDMRRCGQNDKSNLSDGDTVHVYANQECGS